MKLKKTIIILNDETSQEELAKINQYLFSDKDVIIQGDFEIWERDLETGRTTQLR